MTARDRSGDRKVGEATLGRIDELAAGWTVNDRDLEESAPGPEGSSTTRAKRKSVPPPPPPGRRKARTSAPPPPPPGRKKARTSAPPPPPPGRKKLAASEPPAVAVLAEIASRAQATSSPVSPVHAIEPAEDRAGEEATVHQAPGSGEYPLEGARKVNNNSTGTVRVLPSLPRRKGIVGDMRYVLTAAFGIAGSRRELAAVERKLASEKKERDRRLVEIARKSIGDEALDGETLRAARDELLEIEERRSRRAGGSAATDEEIVAVEREREEVRTRSRRAIEALEREIRTIEDKLEPLERRAQAARRKATRLKQSLADLDRRMVGEEAALSGSDGREHKAELEANIASMRAEREAVAREEPEIAAELDNLEPAIASLTSARDESRAEAEKLQSKGAAALLRTAEMMTALRARKAVEERAVSELARDREDALRGLGERLNVERPPEIAPRLGAIADHELAIGMLERRRVELCELVAGIDRWAIARGLLYLWLLAGALAGVLIWYLVYP